MFNTIFAEKIFKNVFLGKKLMFVYSKSEGNWPWRRQNGVKDYTLFVRFGDECSSSFCVTAVDISFWASIEPKVLRKSWDFKSANPAFWHIFLHRLWLKLSTNIFSWSEVNREMNFESSFITSPMVFLGIKLSCGTPWPPAVFAPRYFLTEK